MTAGVRPFRIAVAAAELDDLADRLRRTRWPDRETVADWSQGVPLAELRDLCAYWAGSYDWRAAEARLNAYLQYQIRVDGLDVHVVVAGSPEPDALPLLMTHGWPSSIVEFLAVLGPLTDPVAHGGEAADAFTVVCPSLPGYGFTERPTAPGWDTRRTARAWTRLMDELGYPRYGVQGGDWGGAVGTDMALQAPAPIVGLHLTMPVVGRDDADPRASEIFLKVAQARGWDMEYANMLSRFPQTLGYGFTDSPAALAAWVLQRFRTWADCDGDLFSVLRRDDFLTNLMLYWLPRTAASAGRMYWESPSAGYDPVDVPTGFSVFAKDFRNPSRRAAERRYRDIRWWRQLPRGGHFPAWERPDVFVEEVRGFFRPLRTVRPEEVARGAAR
jgi:pimeloyl-ACP methyl ester carboxylesterase